MVKLFVIIVFTILVSSEHLPTFSLPVDNGAASTELLDKYSQEIGQKVTNQKLYKLLDEWIGVRYRYAGNSKSGVDCSHFVCTVLREAYDFSDNYYYPSRSLAEQGYEVSWKDKKEGDLVCFSINKSSRISHIGVYLGNDKFVHASSSKGVIISSLDDPYYISRLVNVKASHQR